MYSLTIYWYMENHRAGTCYNITATEALRLVRGGEKLWERCRPVVAEPGSRGRIITVQELERMAERERQMAEHT